jgi:AraC family transcriptional regulator, transcriptional activator of pobA
MSTFKQTTSEQGLSFDIRTFDWLKQNMGVYNGSGQQHHFQIVWVTRGRGRYCIDMQSYPLVDNSLFFIPQGRMQQLRPEGELAGYVLSFDLIFLHLCTAGAGRPLYDESMAGFQKVMVMSLGEKRAEGILMNVVNDMIREFEEHLVLRQEILSGLLNIFLMYLQRMSTRVRYESATSKKVHLFNSFYSKVEKEYMTKRLVADYASALSVTPNYLSDVVKRVTGFTASYHIQQRMVLEAKRLAIYSDSNMKLIAYKLGFDDLSHFSKFFKNAAGVNFSEFRNRNGHVFPMSEYVGAMSKAE